MRRPRNLGTTLIAGATAALALSGCFASAELWLGPMAPARPRAETIVALDDGVTAADAPHVSVFYDPLADYGAWEQDHDLGWIWSPSDPAFAPYRDGHWVDTDAGPTWVADEPYGWATSHYGRWFYRERWYWVPDTVWAPAWVAWRVGEGSVGWAPLGPSEIQAPIPIEDWSFVAAADFYTRGVAMRRASPSYAGWFLYRTRAWAKWASLRGEARYVIGPRVALRGRPLTERVSLGSLPQERVRWLPRWTRPAIPRHYASVRAGLDGPTRAERAPPVK